MALVIDEKIRSLKRMSSHAKKRAPADGRHIVKSADKPATVKAVRQANQMAAAPAGANRERLKSSLPPPCQDQMEMPENTCTNCIWCKNTGKDRCMSCNWPGTRIWQVGKVHGVGDFESCKKICDKCKGVGYIPCKHCCYGAQFAQEIEDREKHKVDEENAESTRQL